MRNIIEYNIQISYCVGLNEHLWNPPNYCHDGHPHMGIPHDTVSYTEDM